MYCICCKKNNVIPDTFSYTKKSMRGVGEKVEEEDILWKDSKRLDGSLVNVTNEMIDNGIIHIIDAGYGSTHDGDQFIIAICDDCIKENLQDATLLYYGSYMVSGGDVWNERENSKKKYRRRKNLDDIV
jgi:hypothetical protein